MMLTITNLIGEPESVATPDGIFSQLLQPGQAFTVRNDAPVLIVGDKPDAREQVSSSFERTGGRARTIFEVLTRRREQVQAQTGVATVVQIDIANSGPYPVRALLGGGMRQATVHPGTRQVVGAKGYVELREMNA